MVVSSCCKASECGFGPPFPLATIPQNRNPPIPFRELPTTRRTLAALTWVFLRSNIPSMAWEVEFTNEFEGWWNYLDEDEQASISASVELLEEYGPRLGFPHSSQIKGAEYSHLRELRVQHDGEPYRILYAFDPRRVALLLIGGNKGGDDRWYDRMTPVAERLYAEHLRELKKEES